MGAKKIVSKAKRQAKTAKDELPAALRVEWGLDGRPKTTRGPGMPTLPDDELAVWREKWIHFLEVNWPWIGWQLTTARSPEDIAKAFQRIAGENCEGLTSSFLRPTAQETDAKRIRETRKSLGNAIAKWEKLRKQRDELKRDVQDAEAAVYELSDKNKEQLREEVRRRRENVRQFNIEISRKKSAIRKVELASKGNRTKEDGRQVELNTLRQALAKLEADRDAEAGIEAGTRKRLAAITSERRAHATELLAERQTTLGALEMQVSSAEREYKEVETALLDQEAYFFRSELFDFIRDKRYARDPLRIANALAGMPHMSCRRSAARCADMPRGGVPSLTYEVFLFIERTWKKHSPDNAKHPEQLIRAAIAKLPKTELAPSYADPTKKKRKANYLKGYLQENWAYLRPAIEEGTRKASHPNEVPFLITSLFQDNLSKPRTAADILFAQQQKLPSN